MALWTLTSSSLLTGIHALQKRTSRKAKQFPYMNDMLRKAINIKGMLRRKYGKMGNNVERFRIYRNLVKKKEEKKRRKKKNLVTKLKCRSFRPYLEQRCNNGAQRSNNTMFRETIGTYMTEKCNISVNIILKEGDEIIAETTEICKYATFSMTIMLQIK